MGRLLSLSFWSNADRTGPVGSLFFATNMLVNTDEGDTYSFRRDQRVVDGGWVYQCPAAGSAWAFAVGACYEALGVERPVLCCRPLLFARAGILREVGWWGVRCPRGC